MNNPVEILILDNLKENISLKFLFMGLAKNTGKTTALNYVRTLLQSLTKQKIILISTGYDGEESDALSGLPKPKILVSKGNVFITAKNLLTDSNNFRILSKFPFQTPFGKILLVEALGDCSICLVSPGNNESIRKIIKYVESIFDRPIFLIDGSINRKAFLKLATQNDLLILSTGAAFSTVLQEHIIEIDFLQHLFSILKLLPKSKYKRMQTIDDSSAKLIKNENILLPDVSSVFMTSGGYSNLIERNSKIFYEKLAPSLSLITINPFNPFGRPINQKQFSLLLKNRFPNISIVDIHQLTQC